MSGVSKTVLRTRSSETAAEIPIPTPPPLPTRPLLLLLLPPPPPLLRPLPRLGTTRALPRLLLPPTTLPRTTLPTEVMVTMVMGLLTRRLRPQSHSPLLLLRPQRITMPLLLHPRRVAVLLLPRPRRTTTPLLPRPQLMMRWTAPLRKSPPAAKLFWTRKNLMLSTVTHKAMEMATLRPTVRVTTIPRHRGRFSY